MRVWRLGLRTHLRPFPATPVAPQHLHVKANTTVSAALTLTALATDIQKRSITPKLSWRAAHPTYNLCDKGGYFCCLPGKLCYSNGNTDGCADEGYKLSAEEYFLHTISQVQPSTTSGARQSSGSPAASQTTAPSNKTLSTSPSPLSASSSSSSGGLSRSDKINLAVPIAIGIPGLIISFWLAWRKWKRDKHKQASSR